jgi:hypothetical protein
MVGALPERLFSAAYQQLRDIPGREWSNIVLGHAACCTCKSEGTLMVRKSRTGHD